MILNSKMESMWKIIKTGTDKTNQELRVQSLKINNAITDNHTMITNTFNKNFIISSRLNQQQTTMLRVVKTIIKKMLII